jgi:cis-L-3-hydroxyproline dehydratase
LGLIKNGLGPKALIFERIEEILTLGIIVAEEFFGMSVPVVQLPSEEFRRLAASDGETLYLCGNRVSNSPLGHLCPVSGGAALGPQELELSDFDRTCLDGTYGEGVRLSMSVIARIAGVLGSSELMTIQQAHVDGAWYDPASIAFGKKLRDLNAVFRVLATVNSLTVDLKRWRSLGLDEQYSETCATLADIFLGMGGKVSYTCAPYLLESIPKLGEAVAWGESNAVIYANSVLGARTLKNPNMLECLIAVTGRASKAGVYLAQNHLASIWIRVQPPAGVNNSFWPVLGYSAGMTAKDQVPVLTGLESLAHTRDGFKAFSAAFATSSSAPMFHVVGLTPEAPTLQAVYEHEATSDAHHLTSIELRQCWERFNQAPSTETIDLVSFGNPHLSFQEIKKVANLCRGRLKTPAVAMIITCSRSQYGLAGTVHAAESVA